MAIDDKLKVTRNQLAEFIDNHDTIKQFERLFDYINTFVIPSERSGGIGIFATSGTKEGYIQYTNNSSSQADYPTLFAEIGHRYNDLHVLAGDADLSASGTLFYPTPPPTEDGWLTTWESTPAATVSYPHAKGRYRVTVKAFDGGTSGYNVDLDLDPALSQSEYLKTGFSSVVGGNTSYVKYTVSSTQFDILGQGAYSGDGLITKIEKYAPETLSTDGYYSYVRF
jgi:hypothetical protein